MTSKRNLKSQIELLEESENVDKEEEWWEIEAEPMDRLRAFTLRTFGRDDPMTNMSSREYAEHKEKLKEFVKMVKFMRENEKTPDKNDFEDFEFVEDFNQLIEEKIAFHEYQEKHHEDLGEELSWEGKGFEESMEVLRALDEERKIVEAVYKELEGEDCLSMDALKERAKERGVSGGVVYDWLKKEHLLLELFREERDNVE
ncbi:hypothetical protein AKJ51_02975 [candidate division MSBL1 archaeon SCGC-AAA382A20]|uniref:Uncharacterized protein n=1 Tax=candidate division MSBL1 archaeon SCGC-AAA382A20 TaxID=1698280 RepID=A0A133VJY4_9EURY|nr:hypothetical protein AKJ51_02975 [candidate division MSBL1 archaeon SCGC-AAA382A20]